MKPFAYFNLFLFLFFLLQDEFRFITLIFFQPSLCEKCPNTKFFLVCIFPCSDWIYYIFLTLLYISVTKTLKDLTVSECRVNTKGIFFKKKINIFFQHWCIRRKFTTWFSVPGLHFDNGFSNTDMFLRKYRDFIYVKKGQMS